MNRVMSSLLCGFILLVFFTLQSNAQYTLTLELPDTNIWEMVVDRNGILWITDVDTLKSFDGTSWASYPEYEVTKLQSDENGIIWFGGSKEHSDGKFFKYEGAQFVEVMDYPDNLKEPFTFAVHEGNIWLWDADIDRFHLYYFNGVSWIDYTETNELTGTQSTPFLVDSTGALLIGTDTGLHRFDRTTWTTFTTEDGLIGNRVGAVYVDSKGYIWIGNSGVWGNEGLSRYDGTEWKSFSRWIGIYDYQKQIVPCCFTEDSSGALWFGHNIGAGKFVDGEMLDLRCDEICDFPIIEVNSVAADANGNIWFGSYGWNAGLYKLETTPVHAEEIQISPNPLELTCHPNPFNASTAIRYTLPESAPVSLAVYNINGQQVRRYDRGMQPAGAHEVNFDAEELPSGVYFARIEAGKHSKVTRMLLLR